MSKLKNFFKKSVCACKLGLAYVKAIGVLVKAACQRWKVDGSYSISFVKFGRKWYCEVPGFPKELFEHTLMVGGAAKLLNHYAKDNIRVNAVAPGVTNTDMVANLPEAMREGVKKTIPLGRIGEPEDIANAFLYLASDAASYVTGEILSVDGCART